MSKAKRGSPDWVSLSPAEAVRRYEQDPNSVVVTIADACRYVGVSLDEFRKDAAAGLVTVHGKPQSNGGWTGLHITGANLIEWQVAREMRKLQH